MKKSSSVTNSLDTLITNNDCHTAQRTTNGNNINNTTSNKKGHKHDGDEKASSGSLSLNDLETVSNIPSKDLNNKNRHYHNNHHSNRDNYEPSGFVRVIKSSNNSSANYKSSNGDAGIGINSNNLSANTTSSSKQRSSSYKHSKQPKAPPVESDYELDISDSEESTASSSRLDNSPKSNRQQQNNSSNSLVENLQCKLKDEQIARCVFFFFLNLEPSVVVLYHVLEVINYDQLATVRAVCMCCLFSSKKICCALSALFLQ